MVVLCLVLSKPLAPIWQGDAGEGMVGVDTCRAVGWPTGDEPRRGKTRRKNDILFKGTDFSGDFSKKIWAHDF